MTIYADGSLSNHPLTADQARTLVRSITTKRGTLKRSLSSLSTSPRAYYVWRMARWHLGLDTTRPILAEMHILNETDQVKAQLSDIVTRLTRPISQE